MSIVANTLYGVSLPCAAEAIVEGYVYKDDGNGRMTKITAANDIAFAVALSSSLDPQTGELVAKSAGDNHGFALLGSGLIVNVKTVGSQTYQFGAMVYLDDTTDGMVTATAAGSRPIGHYVGPDGAQPAAGDMIPVYLDVPIGEATA